MNTYNTNQYQQPQSAQQPPSVPGLPDVPLLTPGSAYSSSLSTYERRSNSVLRSSPSPTRPGLYGPRLRPNGSPQASPSTSPNRNYYDHRNSWKSEYSVSVLNAEPVDDYYEHFDDFEKHSMDLPDSPPKPTYHTSNIQIIDENSVLDTPLDFNSTFEPEPVDLPPAKPNASVNKSLPPVPKGIELPTLPFSARSLKNRHYASCQNIFLLSELFDWSIKLTEEWSDGLLVTVKEFKKSLKALIAHRAPKLRTFFIEKNVDVILKSFERQNGVYIDEHHYIHLLTNVKVTGVLPQLSGCYSKEHEKQEDHYQCYSSRCSLTTYQPPIPTVPPKESSSGKLGEWISYWNINEQDLKELDDNEVKKQSHIFELIRQQQNIIHLGEIQVKIYGQSFKTTTPQLLPDISKFYNDAFNSVKPLIELHRKHLLEPLINKLNSQGQYITGVGEIFLKWSQICTVPYIKYTEKLASVRELIKFEKARDSRFAQWLYQLDQTGDVLKASLDHNRIFFSGFIGHTQLLSLALQSVHRRTLETDEDFELLSDAVVAINKLNRKIDEKQDSALQSRHLKVLAKQLVWKSNVLETDLQLSDSKRRLVKKGYVIKKDKWTNSNILLILLDNYLLITEEKENSVLKIIEKPLPIEFLQIETKDLTQDPNSEIETYPFKIRYTGQNISHKFYAETQADKDSWFQSFSQVKSKKDITTEQEQFEITILSDQFAYEEGDEPQKLPVCTPGSNIDLVLRAFQQQQPLEQQQLDETSVSRPVMFSEALSATTFHFQGKEYHALGLNFGLFITESDSPRGWKRVLDLHRITQIEQLESLFVLLADKALYYFNIVSLLLNYYDMNSDGHIPGERLSKKDVSYFKIGSYYGTKLLFMMKTPLQTLGPRFKVFTPIFDHFGAFQHFQLYKKFQFGTDCYNVSIFNSMFVLHTYKGFEILSFQVLYESQSIPKFIEITKKPKTEIDLIKKKLKSNNCKPLKMVKVPNKPQFYLIYDSFVMVIDTIGQLISDKFIFPFKFKCLKVSLQDNYLVAIGVDIVEIFDLSYDDANGFTKFDPIQIIMGKNIKLLDENDSKISMAHPKIPGRQLILKLERLR